MDNQPHQTGFTMLELMMTLAVAAILTVIGVPSFRYVTNANRIAGEVNNLLGDLQFARAEAIKEGRNVTVCVSSDGANCLTTSTTWQNGWVAYSNPTNATTAAAGARLRVQRPFSSSDSFASNGITSITFNREGYAVGIANGTVITLHDSTANTNWTRCLTISLTGMMATAKQGQTVNGATCN